MTNIPAWLPPVTVSSGIWSEDCANLYKIYSDSFVERDCFLDGAKVFPDRTVLEDDFQEGFWHLITKDFRDAKDRLIEPRRAERLVWARSLLENAGAPEVTRWRAKHTNGKIREYLWLKELDYVLILQPLRNGKATQLITAYFVEGDSTRRKLERSFNERIGKATAAS